MYYIVMIVENRFGLNCTYCVQIDPNQWGPWKKKVLNKNKVIFFVKMKMLFVCQFYSNILYKLCLIINK